MNRWRLTELSLFILLTVVGQASAQEAPTITQDWPADERLLFPGDKVRITAPELVAGIHAGYGQAVPSNVYPRRDAGTEWLAGPGQVEPDER